jgi:hypothetical protein
MMPVIRVPDDVFRRLQKIATPFVDTPASVIEKLLDSHEANAGTCTPQVSREDEGTNSSPEPVNAGIIYETYENKNNPHVTIHKGGCSQLRKHGGVHRHGQGAYKEHGTIEEAGDYAGSTGLPIRFCGYCESADDDTARRLVIDYVRAHADRAWQEAEIKGATGVGRNRVRGLLAGHPNIDQAVLSAGAVLWKP